MTPLARMHLRWLLVWGYEACLASSLTGCAQAAAGQRRANKLLVISFGVCVCFFFPCGSDSEVKDLEERGSFPSFKEGSRAPSLHILGERKPKPLRVCISDLWTRWCTEWKQVACNMLMKHKRSWLFHPLGASQHGKKTKTSPAS